MKRELRHDMTTYEKPDNCTDCRFRPVVAASVMDVNCPVHGANGDPVVGPPNWPALITVRVED